MSQPACAAFFILYLCSPSLGETSDTIKPGISLAAAKATLNKFGCDADQLKVQLAMAAQDRSHDLYFCPLGDATTLVIEYQVATTKIVKMSAVTIPEHAPRTKSCRHQFRVLEAKFEDGGVYWLKLQRAAK
jgi:hypothetical protein